MQTELDRDLASVMDALLAPAGMMATVPLRRFGRDLPMVAAAPATLPDYFAHFCAEHGDKTFLVDGPLRLTFAETYAAARVVAGGLVAGHGVKTGDRIGIAARNSTSWVVAYMAVLMAGGCATLLNGWWTGEELVAGIDLVGCTLLLADGPRAKRLEGYKHGATVILIEHDCAPLQGLAALTAQGGGADTPLPALTADDLATVLFTSGSTGQSKGA